MVEGNTTANFRAELPHPIDLQGEWQVGLAEFQYPVTYDTIRGCYYDVRMHDDTLHRVRINNNFYSTPQALDRAIQYATKSWWRQVEADKDGHGVHVQYPVAFYYAEDQMRMCAQINHTKVKEVTLDDRLRHALGFAESKLGFNTVAKYAVDVTAGLDTMFVYCSLVSPQYVGDTKTNLLKIIPLRGTPGSIQQLDFPNIHYCDLQVNRFSDVSFSIKGGDGANIPFNFGKVYVKLHLRKKKLFM